MRKLSKFRACLTLKLAKFGDKGKSRLKGGCSHDWLPHNLILIILSRRSEGKSPDRRACPMSLKML